MWQGIIVINKERGCTSHQVVSSLRRILHQKEVGHTGTLDPEATGVLVVGLGNATRSFAFLDESTKLYRAEIIFGQATDTQDATGTPLFEKPDMLVTKDQLSEAILEMTGDLQQIPPMFSAVKVQGQKLYDLARKGMEVERPARTIKILNWNISNLQSEYGFKQTIHCEITCSKGTYIRTVIHDLGMRLGCGAHMGQLTRLRSGVFCLEDAQNLEEIQTSLAQGRFAEHMISMNLALSHLNSLWPDEADLQKIKHGGKISHSKYNVANHPGTYTKVLNPISEVVAVAKLEDAGSYYYWQPVTVFQTD